MRSVMFKGLPVTSIHLSQRTSEDATPTAGKINKRESDDTVLKPNQKIIIPLTFENRFSNNAVYDIDSDAEMLGYGIGVILLNLGFYFAGPGIVIWKVRKTVRNKSQ